MIDLKKFEKELGKLLHGARRLSFTVVSPKGIPQVSLMQFVVDNDLNIYMKFFDDSRKNSALQKNKKCGICVYDKPKYAQMEGEIEFVEDGDKVMMIKELVYKKYGDNEHMRSYLENPNLIFVKFNCYFVKHLWMEEYLFKSEILDDQIKLLIGEK